MYSQVSYKRQWHAINTCFLCLILGTYVCVITEFRTKWKTRTDEKWCEPDEISINDFLGVSFPTGTTIDMVFHDPETKSVYFFYGHVYIKYTAEDINTYYHFFRKRGSAQPVPQQTAADFLDCPKGMN